MKKSNYNFFFPLEGGNYLAFNALKNGLAVIDEETVKAIENLVPGNTPALEEEMVKELTRGGFICDDDFDEYGLLTIRRHSQQYAGNSLGLTTCPSLDCNLACSYCFESPGPDKMNDSVIKALTDFVKGYMESGIKHFDVTWYGGEPLLCTDIIEKLSSEFIALSREYKVAYSAYIITNGTLLTKATAERLRELKVRGAQVTIDGPRDTHDKRRPYEGGAGSFDRIFANLKEAVGIMPISLRTNVDTLNVKEVLKFYRDLEKEAWFGQNLGKTINVHYGYVRKFSSSCKCSKEENLKAGDFYKSQMELQEFLSGYTGKFTSYPQVFSGCVATSINSYVVGPLGELYKCWNHVGNPDKIVGTVFEPIEYNSLYVAYLCESFENDPQCIHCKYLPVCMGGCVDIRVQYKKGQMDSKDCSQWKYFLEETLRLYYTSRIKDMPAEENTAPA